ncbi:MAG: amidohydrolase family protein [Fimbriimonadaceae bacterium]|nr:amidohydrolase family protein [Fimbriimonadaceae bacterium]
MKRIVETIGSNGYGTYAARIEEGRLVAVTPSKGDAEGFLTPGFVDVHIHGAFGIDFMTADREAMGELDRRLADLGYEAWLPTTVTAPPHSVHAALANLPIADSVPGFHLEGPFISRAYPGAQPPEWIVDELSDLREWDAVLDDPRLRVITMAPENPGAPRLIDRLASRGVVVSMGHTAATYDQARRGVEHGARHTTHTFNAMRPLHHREAGVLGLALTDDRVRCELIYDRLHVSPEAARLLIQSKRPDSLIAVSDSSAATGLAEGTVLDMWGHPCVVGAGEVRLASNGALAGSCITLRDAFANLTQDFGPEIAIRMCALNPRAVLGLARPRRWLLWDRDLAGCESYSSGL